MTILKLDRDDGRAWPLWRLWWVLRLMELRAAWIRYDRTRRGWHVLIAIPAPPLLASEVVALQAVMGSDRDREAFNLNRARLVMRGLAPRRWRTNVLFERKLRG